MDRNLASAHAQAALVRSGEVSARELVEASLRAIERLDPDLNAFCRPAAERAPAEAARIRPGDPRPLCGLPLAVKDFLTATERLPTTEGSNAFGDWVADHDSAHVRTLRAAAVAAGMASLGGGSDLCDSTRIPASCCGLIGLKPSRGGSRSAPTSATFAPGT
jgi:amidase